MHEIIRNRTRLESHRPVSDLTVIHEMVLHKTVTEDMVRCCNLLLIARGPYVAGAALKDYT